MGRCEKCEFAKKIYANENWSFIGCRYEPYQGKWVAEIKDCPINTPIGEIKCIKCNEVTLFSTTVSANPKEEVTYTETYTKCPKCGELNRIS